MHYSGSVDKEVLQILASLAPVGAAAGLEDPARLTEISVINRCSASCTVIINMQASEPQAKSISNALRMQAAKALADKSSDSMQEKG